MAYSARCQHSDLPTTYGAHPPKTTPVPLPPNGFLDVLARHGERLLAGDSQ